MDPIQLMRINETNMTKSEIRIMHYVIDNLEEIKNTSMEKIAEYTDTSRSALLRFSRKLGYQGYSQFKYAISQYLLEPVLNTKNDKSPKTIAEIYSDTITRLDVTVDINQLENMKNLFQNANKIKVFGHAETGLSSIHFCQRLLDIGYDAEAVMNINSYQGKVEISNDKDVFVFFTLSANTDVIKTAMNRAIELNRKIVLVTQNGLSPVRGLVDCFIQLPFHEYNGHDFLLDSQIVLLGFSGMFINYLR